MLKLDICFVFISFVIITCFSKQFNAFRRYDTKKYQNSTFKLTTEQKELLGKENPFEDSGYIEVDKKNGGHLYYMFFENEKKDPEAPLLIWLAGGPGCSSTGSSFTEMGPYYIDEEDQTLKKRKGAWTEDYQMLFIDNPVGTGFSYVENEEGYCKDQICVQNALYNFLEIFMNMTKHKHLANNDIHIYGQSYAGKYVPSFAHIIQEKGFKYNLKSIGIGNGLVYPEFQLATYSDFALSTQVIDIGDYSKLKDLENKTATSIRNRDFVRGFENWSNSLNYLKEQSDGINIYDIRTHEEEEFKALVAYLNNPTVQEFMHSKGNWEYCDPDVFEYMKYDIPKSVLDYVVQLLDESDVKVLIYSGQWDLIINTMQTVYGFVEFIPWKFQKEYSNQKREHWRLENGEWAGTIKKYHNLYGCIVANCGHSVPEGQLFYSKDMVRNMIEGKW